jgi:RNA polymerase sigma-32 factor
MLQIDAPKWTAEGGLNYSAERLVVDHQPLARARARKYFVKMRRAGGCGGSVDDLEGEALLGLMKAIKRFDPTKGFAFGTYAIWWIDAALREFASRNRSIVRQPRPVLVKAAQPVSGAPKPSLPVLRFTGTYKSSGPDTSTDAVEGDALDHLIGSTANPETTAADRQQTDHRAAMLIAAIGTLNPRERAIVSARHGDDEPATLGELAKEFGISAERVRQIESAALDKINRHVRNAAGTRPAFQTGYDRQIAAMRPSKERTDSILRHCVSGSFGMDRSPDPEPFAAKMRNSR